MRTDTDGKTRWHITKEFAKAGELAWSAMAPFFACRLMLFSLAPLLLVFRSSVPESFLRHKRHRKDTRQHGEEHEGHGHRRSTKW
mmetsp:Transcript_13942/g.38316  ORF Transcript_13942/g.38316 Transcript_13942/m.38316 type:complete len:85 (+) Transcript_13942:44-298(+)